MKNKYYCKHCKKTVVRDSEKAWIKSMCDETGKDVHLMLLKKAKKRREKNY